MPIHLQHTGFLSQATCTYEESRILFKHLNIDFRQLLRRENKYDPQMPDSIPKDVLSVVQCLSLDI